MKQSATSSCLADRIMALESNSIPNGKKNTSPSPLSVVECIRMAVAIQCLRAAYHFDSIDFGTNQRSHRQGWFIVLKRSNGSGGFYIKRFFFETPLQLKAELKTKKSVIISRLQKQLDQSVESILTELNKEVMFVMLDEGVFIAEPEPDLVSV